jgi:hypothetical protein
MRIGDRAGSGLSLSGGPLGLVAQPCLGQRPSHAGERPPSQIGVGDGAGNRQGFGGY